jgi:predicted anti-sigma-YlaC factor YlaD
MCGTVRELIPDFVGSRLSPEDLDVVERHVVDCRECRAELELAQVIMASRRSAPPELLDRLLRSVGTTRHQPVRAWWAASAAAIAALALGIGISSDPSRQAPLEVPGYAYEVGEGDIWLSDDGLLAGAPLFDDLSDDALLQLLDELSVGSAGGSA